MWERWGVRSVLLIINKVIASIKKKWREKGGWKTQVKWGKGGRRVDIGGFVLGRRHKQNVLVGETIGGAGEMRKIERIRKRKERQ